jgi:hypothetical protein
MAKGIALIRVAKISMRIDLEDAEVRIHSRMSPNGAQRAGMLAGQRDDQPTGLHMRVDEPINGLHRLPIDTLSQV